MRDNALAEKCPGPVPGPVDELVLNHDVAARHDLLLERTHRRQRQDPSHAERFERADVRARIDFGRQNPVAPARPGQKRHARAAQPAHADAVGRFAEGRVDFDFLKVLDALHIINAAAADHADRRRAVRRGHLFGLCHDHALFFLFFKCFPASRSRWSFEMSSLRFAVSRSSTRISTTRPSRAPATYLAGISSCPPSSNSMTAMPSSIRSMTPFIRNSFPWRAERPPGPTASRFALAIRCRP